MYFQSIFSLFVLLLAGLVAADGGYRDSCKEFSSYWGSGNSAGRYWLSANCKNSHGSYELGVMMNLDRCFANVDGNLKGKWNGGYQKNCRNISMKSSSRMLTAECKNNAGKWVSTQIDTNRHIGNSNGFLKCHGRSAGP
jgi:hypothetical protein